MDLTYLRDDYTYEDPITNQTIELKKGQHYEGELVIDGPIMVVNGMQFPHPDGTVWAELSNGVRIPYAPELVESFWRA